MALASGESGAHGVPRPPSPWLRGPAPGAAPRREVSCLALTFFYDYMRAHGIPRAAVQRDLPYSPEHLDDRLRWIDLDTFCTIERRFAELFPSDPDVFFRVGTSLGRSGGLGFLTVIARQFIRPEQVYGVLPMFVGRFLFPFVTVQVEDAGPSHLQANYRFEKGCAPSAAFVHTTRGILTSVPCIFGGPPARVDVRHPSPLDVTFDIELPPEAPRRGVLGELRAGASFLRMRWRNGLDVARELLDANHLLQEQVAALTVAKTDLTRTVRDLRILNVLAREGTSELEIGPLARKAAAILCEQLGVASVVLVTEGEPPALVVAAAEGVDAAMMHDLAALRDPRDPATVSVLDRASPAARELALGGSSWVVVQLRSRDRSLGALALASGVLDDHAPAFLESLGSQLAVALDNATSYRLVADLRDNLERRVHERTSDLESARVTLEATVERLDHADRAKRDFFMNVSHELKTPLALILAPLDDIEGVLDVARDPGALASVAAVRSNALRLRRLVDEVLDFARFDAGNVPLSIEPVDLGELVSDVRLMLQPIADRERVALRYDAPPRPVVVMTDAKLVHRVLVNLLGNAVKYAEAGDEVEARLVAGTAGVTIEIVDTGPGIARDELTRIFERFQRARDRRGRVVEGSGIGLSLVREAVVLLGGTIEVESEVGRGTVFRICVPLVHAQSSAPASAQPATGGLVLGDLSDLAAELRAESSSVAFAPGAATEAGAREGRVLLVDDNADMRAFLGRVLARRFSVRVASDGAEALEAAIDEVPDVVLSDVMMPRMDGEELCRRLKADARTTSTKVLLVSARHGTAAALSALAAGADDFIVKPFSTPELLARVATQLRIQTLSQRLAQSQNHRTLGVLAAGIAHEVKNPVHAVLNAAPVLRVALDRMATPDARPGDRAMIHALLGAIEDSGARIQRTVDAVLALARPESRTAHLGKVRLGEGIDAVVRMLAPRAPDVQFHQRIEYDEPFLTDPEMVDQVIMNLCINAQDAIGDAKGNVWITVRATDVLEIRVRDDGPGVAPENVDRIFAPFFTTKAPGQGTGLGLALSRERVLRHAGSLELVSGGARGAELRLTLPFLPPDAASTETRPKRPQ